MFDKVPPAPYTAHLTYDHAGIPGVHAADEESAYFGLGRVHARHRRAQALTLLSAAQGRLSHGLLGLLPNSPLRQLDLLAHGLDAPRLGRAAWAVLAEPDRACLAAYVAGFQAEARVSNWRLWEGRLLGLMGTQEVTPASVLSGILLAAYVSQAHGQARMETLLLTLLRAGAKPAALRALHAPYLQGWEPDAWALGADLGPPLVADLGSRSSGGSNAWAVTGARSVSGAPMLCADPHLEVGDLAGVFCEIRVALTDGQYWLGATIPGLPVLAVGRNRDLAWSGTFACADTVDSFGERVVAGGVLGPDGQLEPIAQARVPLGPSWGWLPWNRPSAVIWRTARGVLAAVGDGAGADAKAPAVGLHLARRWAGGQSATQLAATLQAYLGLPRCRAVDSARSALAGLACYSLHMVLADRGGTVGYQQVGALPHRAAGCSGLVPISGQDVAAAWQGLRAAAALPASGPDDDGVVASANEARLGADGVDDLAPFAQPTAYRLARIHELLAGQRHHDMASMRAIQRDLYAPQGRRLQPRLLAALPAGPLRLALAAWTGGCGAADRGCHAFILAYRAALAALATSLGGEAWRRALAQTEVATWWCRGLDTLLDQDATWQGAQGVALRAALTAVAPLHPRPWGEVQTVTPAHPLAGLVPLPWLQRRLGLRGPRRPLTGTIGTICQGNLVPGAHGQVPVGPAYRLICDLGEDSLRTSLASGRWWPDWQAGIYHYLRPPEPEESRVPPSHRRRAPFCGRQRG